MLVFTGTCRFRHFNLENFSKRLFGLSGAEIAFVTREGAYNCLRRNIDLEKAIKNDNLESIKYGSIKVTKQDFEKALGEIKIDKFNQLTTSQPDVK